MAIRVNEAGLPYKEFQIPITSSASTALNIGAFFKDTNGPVRVELEAEGDNAIICFGSTNAVAASATVASNALTAPNFSLTEGVIESFDANGQSQGWVSVISRDAATNTGATIYIRLCAVNK